LGTLATTAGGSAGSLAANVASRRTLGYIGAMFTAFDAARADACDGLTLALIPDPAIASALGKAATAFAGAHRLVGRQARTDQLALPLFDLGRYAGLPYGIVRQAQEAARRLVLPAPFELIIDRVEAVRGPGGAWMARLTGPETPALIALYADLAASLRRSGLGRRIEIAWSAGAPFLETNIAFPTTPIPPIVWRIDALSLLHDTPSRHQVSLGRWTLG